MKGLPLILAISVTLPCAGQPGDAWRYWTVDDGMMESYSRTVSRGWNGEIWVRHGTVPSLSVLDGREVKLVPDPRWGKDDWIARHNRVWPDGRGQAWSVENHALMRLRGGKWEIAVGGALGQEMIEALPIDPGRVLVLFGNRLELYEENWGSWRRIRSEGGIGKYRTMTAGFDRDVWVAGEQGLGHWDEKRGWKEIWTSGLGVQGLESLCPAKGGRVFASGNRGMGRAVVEWAGDKLRVVAEWEGQSGFGWEGPMGGLWTLEGRNLYETAGGRKVAVQRRGRLSSEIFMAVTEPDGGFWLGTVDGMAHQKPGLWQSPAELREVDQIVHDITEDAEGRLWFAATEWLIELDHGRWEKHRVPGGKITHNLMSRALRAMPDGRVMVKLMGKPGEDRVSLFDPKTKRFEEWKQKESELIRFFKQSEDGGMLVRRGMGFEFGVLRDFRFEKIAELGKLWNGGVVKDMEELGPGVYLLAGAGGAGLLRHGKYEAFSSSMYEGETGFFSSWKLDQGRLLLGGRRKLFEWDGQRLRTVRSGLDRVRSVMVDHKGRIWMATAGGVLRNEDGRWVVNGEEDGLGSGMAHKVFEDRQGRIWAGTTHGLSLYRGERDVDAPRMKLKPQAEMQHASSSGSIRIELGALDRWKQTKQEQLMYSWRLDGGEWGEYQVADAARFEGLDGGRHRMEVRVMDRNGKVDPLEQSVEFEVPLRWHQEPGFVVAASAMGTVIAVLLAMAVRSYRQRGEMVEQLRKAQEDAEAASRQKSLFLANMSHEIRTPMNAILGMNQLALETPNGAEQREYLRMASSSAGELLNLLNDILDLSKVEAGKLELHEESFELRACVNAVARTLELRAREKGLRLEVAVREDVPEYVVGDSHRLKQVLFNLVGNALKFTERGEVKVELGLERGRLEFVVRDTGIGIEAEAQKRIFEPFVQANGGMTRKHGGTGLGLAICGELVRKMGGGIRVESPWRRGEEVVRGSAFYFTIAMMRGEKPPQPAEPEELVEPVAPLRVLVAEDNAINSKLIDRLLSREGHEVLLVANGLEAIEALGREAVDVVLMDVMMPEMDGLEATRRIRQREKKEGGHLRIVAITANALDGDKERCLAAGMDAYLTKPIQLAELRRILQYTVENADNYRDTRN